MDLTEPVTEQRFANVPRRREARPPSPRRAPETQIRTSSLERRAVGLGWFSVGLGLAQLLAPRQMAQLIGADEEDSTTRAALMGVGLRELTTGIGLLSKSRPAAWAWARLAGDVMDLAVARLCLAAERGFA